MIKRTLDCLFWFFYITHTFLAIERVGCFFDFSLKFTCCSSLEGLLQTRSSQSKLHNITFNKKCAAEAAHEKCSFVLLRHSSLPPIGNDNKAYIFTQKVCLLTRILNCVANSLYQTLIKIARTQKPPHGVFHGAVDCF